MITIFIFDILVYNREWLRLKTEEKTFEILSLEGLYISLKIPPQQLPMPLAFLYNLKPIIAHEINQPFAGNILKIMRPRDPQPAAGDPSADGFVLVAEDGFHFLGCDDVGQVVPLIVEPGAEVFGNLVRVEVVLIGLPFAGVI